LIAKLKGLLDSSGEDWAILDIGGVGYLAFCSSRTLTALPAPGEVVDLAIETHVREDHIHLYGFATRSERDSFRLLTTVQGVGARVCLAILSALSPEDVKQAVAAGDTEMFLRATGVGPKLAGRIVSELKDKVASLGDMARLAVHAGVSGQNDNNAIEELSTDAVSVLCNLGYSRIEAFGAVTRAMQTAASGVTLDNLIRSSLKELGASDV